MFESKTIIFKALDWLDYFLLVLWFVIKPESFFTLVSPPGPPGLPAQGGPGGRRSRFSRGTPTRPASLPEPRVFIMAILSFGFSYPFVSGASAT